MSNKQRVAVVGVTGRQGNSVLMSLVDDGTFDVRAVVSHKHAANVNKDLLNRKGVELFPVDYDSVPELTKAFSGCHGAFALTNFWAPENMQTFKRTGRSNETQQGKGMVDAAEAAGVRHFVYSSLHNADRLSDGKVHVPHFTGKAEVEEYATERTRRNPTFVSSFIYPAMFYANLSTWNAEWDHGEQALLCRINVKEDTMIPWIDVSQVGPFVLHLFKMGPEASKGLRLKVASEYATFPDVLRAVGQAAGVKYKFVSVDDETMSKLYDKRMPGFGEEMASMYKWVREYGYYDGEGEIGECPKICPQVRYFVLRRVMLLQSSNQHTC